jgi:hypothetical protein
MEIEDVSKVLEIVEICRSLPNPHDVMIEQIGLISIRSILPLENYPLLGIS